MIGVLVNTAAIIIGALIGVLCKKGIPEKITNAIMIGIGLCVIYIGISGALKGESTIVLAVSMVLGAVVGTLIDIDDKLTRLGDFAGKKFSKNSKASFSQGFVTASLIFCVGSMAVVGSLNAGLSNDYQMLFTKSLLDMIIAMMLAAGIGIGVAFSSVPILILEGGIVLLSRLLQSVLTQTAINEMTCVGSVIIIALGLNLTGISKFKVANYVPAIIFAPIISWLIGLLPFSI